MHDYRCEIQLYSNNNIVGRIWSGYHPPMPSDFTDGNLICWTMIR